MLWSAFADEDRAATDAAIGALIDFVGRPNPYAVDDFLGGTGDSNNCSGGGGCGLAALAARVGAAGQGADAATGQGLAAGAYSAFAVVQLAVADCAAFCEQSAPRPANEVEFRCSQLTCLHDARSAFAVVQLAVACAAFCGQSAPWPASEVLIFCDNRACALAQQHGQGQSNCLTAGLGCQQTHLTQSLSATTNSRCFPSSQVLFTASLRFFLVTLLP